MPRRFRSFPDREPKHRQTNTDASHPQKGVLERGGSGRRVRASPSAFSGWSGSSRGFRTHRSRSEASRPALTSSWRQRLGDRDERATVTPSPSPNPRADEGDRSGTASSTYGAASGGVGRLSGGRRRPRMPASRRARRAARTLLAVTMRVSGCGREPHVCRVSCSGPWM
jgi:hypothetical protein